MYGFMWRDCSCRGGKDTRERQRGHSSYIKIYSCGFLYCMDVEVWLYYYNWSQIYSKIADRNHLSHTRTGFSVAVAVRWKNVHWISALNLSVHGRHCSSLACYCARCVSLVLSGNFKNYLLYFLLCFSVFSSACINICFLFYLAFYSECVA